MRRTAHGPLRVANGGPVGSGTTMLTERPYKARRDTVSVIAVATRTHV